jgi:mannose-1-phosphate guanylyltransferase
LKFYDAIPFGCSGGIKSKVMNLILFLYTKSNSDDSVQAVILAGGFGKRLRPLTDSIPKPMIKVGGVSILERQILFLKKHGIRDIVICVGYKKDAIIDYFGDGRDFEVRIDYALEKNSLGTGGALRNASNLIHEREFIFMYGDILTDLDIERLRKVATVDKKEEGGKCRAIMATVPLRSPYGIVEIDHGGNNAVLGFKEKPTLRDYWINAGVFCFDRSILNLLPTNGSLESETLEELASKGELKAVKFSDALWRSIDSHKDIEEAEREFDVMSPIKERTIFEEAPNIK